jgi:peptide/nickel transport system ATP-binding protein
VQAQIIALIEKLCSERGTAVLLITHDMGVIARAAQRVAVMYAGRIVEMADTRQIIGAPLHPYARGLMEAIPPLRERPRRLVQIGGAMPRLTSIPKGCSFNPRCPLAIDQCRKERPELTAVGDRLVACHVAVEQQAVLA